MDPLKWGCQLTKQGIIPIEITKQVAPLELLKIVRYNMAVKQTAHGKTTHVDSMELFVLTFVWVAAECLA